MVPCFFMLATQVVGFGAGRIGRPIMLTRKLYQKRLSVDFYPSNRLPPFFHLSCFWRNLLLFNLLLSVIEKGRAGKSEHLANRNVGQQGVSGDPEDGDTRNRWHELVVWIAPHTRCSLLLDLPLGGSGVVQHHLHDNVGQGAPRKPVLH